MLTIEGKYGQALIACDEVEPSAMSQIYDLMNCEVAENAHVRIMPDVHAGAGCVIGTSMHITDKVVPNLVGVDIGCGVTAVQLWKKEIDLSKLDEVIRQNVPCGREVYDSMAPVLKEMGGSEYETFIRNHIKVDPSVSADLDRAVRSLGTLGGGNHFIELGKDSAGDLWLIVHSGSRHFGLEVAKYYQDLAAKTCRKKGVKVPKGLEYLTGMDMARYIKDMCTLQLYAVWNRATILRTILNALPDDQPFTVSPINTVHNYIDTDPEILTFEPRDYFLPGEAILRKGAVSAKKGESLLIPLNMRDGTLLCRGKGNAEWNFTAPHGAGRIMSRSEAKGSLSMNDFQKDMEGVFTTCVKESTLDEAPRAYKSKQHILENLDPMVKVIDILKPVYNFKAN